MTSFNPQPDPVNFSDLNRYFNGANTDKEGHTYYLKVGNNGVLSYVNDKSQRSSLSSIFKAINNRFPSSNLSITDLEALKKSARTYFERSKEEKPVETREKVHFYGIRKFFSDLLAKNKLSKLEKSLTKYELAKSIQQKLSNATFIESIVEKMKLRHRYTVNTYEWEFYRYNHDNLEQDTYIITNKSTIALQEANNKIERISSSLLDTISREFKKYELKSDVSALESNPIYTQIYSAYHNSYTSVNETLEMLTNILKEKTNVNINEFFDPLSIGEQLLNLKNYYELLDRALKKNAIIKNLKETFPTIDEHRTNSQYSIRLDRLIKLYSVVEIFGPQGKEKVITKIDDVFTRLRDPEIQDEEEKIEIIIFLLEELASDEKFQGLLKRSNENENEFNAKITTQVNKLP